MPELKCEKVDDFYLLRDGASGIFLAASQFPKNRETRAPLISEIKPHANELDPKFKYLLDAPVADPDGLPGLAETEVLRFRVLHEHLHLGRQILDEDSRGNEILTVTVVLTDRPET